MSEQRSALGFIETVGLVAAIASADAAAKAANVTLLGRENSKGGGFITVKIAGEIGAVNAALMAAKAACEKVSRVWAVHALARPASGILPAFAPQPSSPNKGGNDLSTKVTGQAIAVSVKAESTLAIKQSAPEGTLALLKERAAPLPTQAKAVENKERVVDNPVVKKENTPHVIEKTADTEEKTADKVEEAAVEKPQIVVDNTAATEPPLPKSENAAETHTPQPIKKAPVKRAPAKPRKSGGKK